MKGMTAMKRFGSIVITAIALLFTTSSIWGQDNPAFELGTRAFGSYRDGGIDQTNLSTGNTSVYIPLISYPQRGAHPPLEFGLNYTNRGFAMSWSCELVGGSVQYGGVVIPPVAALCLPSTVVLLPYQSGFSIIERSGAARVGPQVFDGTCQGLNPDIHGNYLQFNCSASVGDWDGAIHQMAPVSSTKWEAVDNTGYRLDSTAGNLIQVFGTNNVGIGNVVLTDRNGIRSWVDPTSTAGNTRILREDSNGNQITWQEPGNLDTTTGYVDTMGRNIPSLLGTWGAAFENYLNLGTVVGGTPEDPSGCTGPLPVMYAFVWAPPGPNGGTYPIKFCYVDVVETLPAMPNPNNGGQPDPPATVHMAAFGGVLQSIVLPNGTAWTFEYTNDGPRDLAKITFPTGATLSYVWTSPPLRTWSGNPGTDPLNFTRGIAVRTLDPANGGPVSRTTYSYPSGFPFTTIVTDAAGNDTVHLFGQFGTQLYETTTQFYQGSSSGGTPLKTIQNSYSGPASPFSDAPVAMLTGQTTIWPNGQQRQTQYDYTTRSQNFVSTGEKNLSWFGMYDNQGNFLYNNSTLASAVRQVSATREYDWGANAPGPLLHQTVTGYLWQNNGNYLANNLIDLVSSTTVYDGSGNRAAQTLFGFDETPLIGSGISTQLDSSPPVPGGNTTSVTNVVLTPANACNSNTASTTNIVTRTQYFDTGEVARHIDALGNATTFSYSPAFAGALPTGVCNALGQCITTSYDFNTGLKTSVTDANGQIASYQYDTMKRLTKIINPAQVVNGSAISGADTITYADTPGALSVLSSAQQDGSTSITRLAFFDGLGRAVGTQLNDPRGNVFTQTTYDSMGRPATASNPYRSTSEATYGITQTNYDALGRVTLLTHPDGSTEVSNYSRRAVQALDAGNGTSRVSLISQVDGLGRLTSVCEVTGATQVNGDAPGACGQDIPGTGFLTTYQYDSLGNLTGVSQGSVTRSFVYDSASRLVSATNPESGTTCYQYDANGNVVARIRPAANQSNPAVTVTTNYQYDALNRPTVTSYSDSVTPTVTKHYDTTSELGITLNNTVGRLSAEYVTSPSGQLLAGKVFSYDSRGNTIDNSQCTPQNCGGSTVFPTQYSYDLLGKPLTASNGVGTVFTYTFDGAGRLSGMTSSLSDGSHPGTLLSGTNYNALGTLSSGSLGTALNESFVHDCRGRLTSFASAVAPALPSPSINQTPGCPGLASSNDGRGYPKLYLDSAIPSVTRKDWMPLHSVGSIVISGTAQGGELDRGSLSIKITPLNATDRAKSLTLTYVAGDSALAIAQKCAGEINRDLSHRITARVKEIGSIAVVELMETGTATGPGFFVAASIHSDQTVPSITVTASGPSRKMPLLLSQIQPLTAKTTFLFALR